MQRQIAGLFALAGDDQVRNAAPHSSKIPDLQLAQFLTAERVIEQRRQDRAVALFLDALVARCAEQLARLVVAERRRLALAAFNLRSFDAFDRVVGDGVLFAEVFE